LRYKKQLFRFQEETMLKQVTAELLLLVLIFCTAAKTAMADELSNERDKM
jgi:hypothetical protein